MNKDIFLKVINNKVLNNTLFTQVNNIHKNILKVEVFSWNELTDNLPLLAYYNYLDQFKLNLENNQTFIESVFGSDFKRQKVQPIIFSLLKGNSFNVFKYFIERYPDILNTLFSEFDRFSWGHDSGDLLHFAIKYNRPVFIEYLLDDSHLAGSTEWNYINAFTYSPLTNDLDFVKAIFKKTGEDSLSQLVKNEKDTTVSIPFFYNAAKLGRDDMIEWFINQAGQDQYATFKANIGLISKYAIGGNQLEFIQKHFDIISENEKCRNLGDLTSLYGQLEILKYLHHNGIGFTTKAMDYAAQTQNLEIIKWLHSNRTEGCSQDAMEFAAKHCNFEILNFLHSNRTEGCSVVAMDIAAQYGHLEVLKWFHKNRTEEWGVYPISYAAEYGHLECVQWLHENHPEIQPNREADRAAGEGHLEVVKWLYVNRRLSYSSDGLDLAAGNGHLEVVKWLHANTTDGCSEMAISWASQNGHLETVQWLHANTTEGGTDDMLDYVAMNGHYEIAEFCKQNNRTERATTAAIDNAGWNGDLKMIKWLHENSTEGCTVAAMNNAAWSGSLETVKWLHENRTEGCTTLCMNVAAQNGHLHIIKWLHENRTEGCTEEALESNHFGIKKWLLNNRTEFLNQK